jgi:hypothetical protein
VLGGCFPGEPSPAQSVADCCSLHVCLPASACLVDLYAVFLCRDIGHVDVVVLDSSQGDSSFQVGVRMIGWVDGWVGGWLASICADCLVPRGS